MEHRSKIRGAAIVMLGLISAMPAIAQAQSPEFISRGLAPEDPLIAWGEQDAGRSHFFLNTERDVEIIRFRSARDIELCAPRPQTRRDGKISQYPIKVTWDAQSSIIEAGNCMSFDAQRVSVRPASSLPEDIVLEGTYRVSK